ncbi:hypothetical protein LO772_03930 [Yinghuangia sp. ASG 101]|uniref:hypothetical protein n=1 Tax=Yinghuangia sp. ASG 101 TaxID=2896848 RepID=UPI001E2A9D6A|nr:hypothetical protein [Yinghuangia sp. ASG 101]UGQ12781.1 hypothetical protein LO772_03930 [Yinghuangia sp. ASG 101]
MSTPGTGPEGPEDQRRHWVVPAFVTAEVAVGVCQRATTVQYADPAAEIGVLACYLAMILAVLYIVVRGARHGG